jgi:hypothetical protein
MGLGDEWRPNRCGMVLYFECLKVGPRTTALHVMVDPKTPNVWKTRPYYEALKKLSKAFPVFVLTGSRNFLITRDRDIEETAGQGLRMRFEEDGFQAETYPTTAHP